MAKNRILFDPKDLIFISENTIRKLSNKTIILLIFTSIILGIIFSYSFIKIYGSPRSRSYDKHIHDYYWEIAFCLLYTSKSSSFFC